MMPGMEYGGGDRNSSLAACLDQTISDAFMMYFMAHSYHWNVTGPEFTQFHSFFSDIYEDVHGSIDHLAEAIVKIGYKAPMHLMHICNSTEIPQSEPGCDPISMSRELYGANERVIADLYATFDCAIDVNQQGIANFLADRIGAHEKWRWQIGMTIGIELKNPPVMPGKLIADLPLEATDGFVVVEDQPVGIDVAVFAAASKPAPKKDRIYGSKKNKPGSAEAKNAKTIKFSDKTETALRNKMQEHNGKASAGRKTTMAQLKAVYRRGAGAYSSSHRPGKTRDQWAMARVNAYLKLLSSGRPENSNYTQDNDLLPSGHPRSSKNETSIIAAAEKTDLTVRIGDQAEYATAEEAIFALAEFSDLGYEMIPSLRASWKRAVNANENPFARAYELATLHYDSRDADLLPIQQ